MLTMISGDVAKRSFFPRIKNVLDCIEDVKSKLKTDWKVSTLFMAVPFLTVFRNSQIDENITVCLKILCVFYSMSDLDRPLMQEIMEFIYWLVEVEELPIAKALRQILVDKQKQIHFQQVNIYIYVLCILFSYILFINLFKIYTSLTHYTRFCI